MKAPLIWRLAAATSLLTCLLISGLLPAAEAG